jgi:hypothetical protein
VSMLVVLMHSITFYDILMSIWGLE